MAELFSVAKAIIQPSNATQPVELGVLQEVSIDFTINKKELKGQNRYPILIAQSDGSVSGKASMARFNPQTLGTLLGATTTTGATLLGNVGGPGQTAQLIPSTPFQVTVVPPSSGVFSNDGGVILVGSSELFNKPMTRIATGTPTTGQYIVNTSTGKYTFAVADVGKQIVIDYIYTTSATSTTTITIPNPVMGNTYPFSLWARSSLQGQDCVIKFNNVISGKLSMPLKLGEWSIFDFDFDVFADGSGNIGYIYTSY